MKKKDWVGFNITELTVELNYRDKNERSGMPAKDNLN